MRIYFDVCCYNRPFDDYLNDRIEIESNAVLSILNRCIINNWIVIGSEIIDIEISKIKNELKRQQVFELASLKNEYIMLNDCIENRAIELEQKGIKAYDCLHLACSEYSNADVFLTTDDKLLKSAQNISLTVRILNPVQWFMEVIQSEDDN